METIDPRTADILKQIEASGNVLIAAIILGGCPRDFINMEKELEDWELPKLRAALKKEDALPSKEKWALVLSKYIDQEDLIGRLTTRICRDMFYH